MGRILDLITTVETTKIKDGKEIKSKKNYCFSISALPPGIAVTYAIASSLNNMLDYDEYYDCDFTVTLTKLYQRDE